MGAGCRRPVDDSALELLVDTAPDRPLFLGDRQPELAGVGTQAPVFAEDPATDRMGTGGRRPVDEPVPEIPDPVRVAAVLVGRRSSQGATLGVWEREPMAPPVVYPAASAGTDAATALPARASTAMASVSGRFLNTADLIFPQRSALPRTGDVGLDAPA